MTREELIYIKTSELIPYINNPRNNDVAVDAVASSIKNFGFKVPIVIGEDKEIINGHTRLKAARKLNLEEVPCIIAKDLTEQEKKAFRLADNKVAELASWDYELLLNEIEGITEFNLEEFGFDLSEMLGPDMQADEVEEDNFDIEEIIEQPPKSKLGQIYKLGNHRLMVGDSTSKEDVSKLTGGVLMDLALTDPPYNVAIGIEDLEDAKARNRRTDGKKIQNDEMSDAEFYNFLLAAFQNIQASLKLGGAFYIWHASWETVNFRNATTDAGLTIKQELIWNKNSMVLGRQDYQWKHEPCLYGWKEGEAHYFTDSRTETTVFEDGSVNYKSMKKDELIKLLDDIFSDKVSTTIINESRPTASKLHPTMKPIKLMARQILNSSRQEEKILDLFGGSGSTLIACEQTNRACYMMEYDPVYADVIIERWEKFTGQQAELIQE